MTLPGCHHSPHRASLRSVMPPLQLFVNSGHQTCTCCQEKLSPLPPRADHQASHKICGQDEAAMKRLLGDSARRLPKQLSAKAQKQLQQLRLERQGPLDRQQSNASEVSEGHTSTSGSAAPTPESTDKDRAEPAAADSDAIERLPTKAELRGTLSTVNRKVYEQVTQSCNRLSVRLSAANKHIRQLQKAAEGHQQEVATMHDCITQIMTELTTLGRAVDATAASMHDGAERSDTVAKMSNLLTRVQSLQQEVRLMGSFDNWTQGFSLSAEEFSDGTFTKFQGMLGLVPGQYEVKFLVDGQWRTAPDWPIVNTQHGANNVLHVE